MGLESDAAEEAKRWPAHPLTVRVQRPVHGFSREDHRTGGNPANDTSALEHLAKFRHDLGVRVSIQKIFRQPTGKPDAARAGQRLNERIRIGNGAVEGMHHGDVLRTLRFEGCLRRGRWREPDLGTARSGEGGRRYEHDWGISTASELDEARQNNRGLGTRENHRSSWRTNSRGTLCGAW